jgi:hypothetical protein
MPRRSVPGPPAGISILAMLVVSMVFPPTAREADAQQEASPVLSGRVEKGGASVPDATVVLHRVTAQAAGEIDSIRVNPEGGFHFALPSVPDPGGRGEVYFASVRYAGVLYFGPPIHEAVQLDSLYVLNVYDTVTAPEGGADLVVAVRYLLSRPAEDGWEIIDLFEIANEGERTLVPASAGGPVWTYPLPEGIRDPTVGEGEIAPDASIIADGSVQITAPIPPGLRRLVLQYHVDDLDLRYPLPGSTGQMELLVREPAPPLEVIGLVPAESVPMAQGVTYRRYAATDLRDATIAVAAGEDPPEIPARNVAVIFAMVLALGGLWAYLRAARGAARSGALSKADSRAGPIIPAGTGEAGGSGTRESFLLEVALIDQALDAPGIEGREAADLRQRRSSLVRRLEDLG